MTIPPQRPLATLLALALTAAFWIPTVSTSVAAQVPASEPITFATPSHAVMM